MRSDGQQLISPFAWLFGASLFLRYRVIWPGSRFIVSVPLEDVRGDVTPPQRGRSARPAAA
jgi:hypothetical protein